MFRKPIGTYYSLDRDGNNNVIVDYLNYEFITLKYRAVQKV